MGERLRLAAAPLALLVADDCLGDIHVLYHKNFGYMRPFSSPVG
jgi:hypothetical protein